MSDWTMADYKHFDGSEELPEGHPLLDYKAGARIPTDPIQAYGAGRKAERQELLGTIKKGQENLIKIEDIKKEGALAERERILGLEVMREEEQKPETAFEGMDEYEFCSNCDQILLEERICQCTCRNKLRKALREAIGDSDE